MRGAGINSIVLDASIAIAWCFEDEASALTRAVLDLAAKGTVFRVPSVFPLEVANGILVAERRQRVTTAKSDLFLRSLAQLTINVDPTPLAQAFHRILPLARQHGLSAYDASYLELSMREVLPFATIDQTLRRSARAMGVEVLDR
jgi:predicted nucleic acid-binding protein